MIAGLTPGFDDTAWRLCRALAERGPVTVSDFDDDWNPAGENYRDELVSGGLAEVGPTEEDGQAMIVLTGAGVTLAQAEAPPAPEPAARR